MAKPGGVAKHPVSLIDLYPTLADLCGLEGDTRKNEKGAPLDGFSVRPFLENPKTEEWEGPDAALTMLHAGENAMIKQADKDYNNPSAQHFSLRTRRWRYIRYCNGKEELYDHDADPREWTNLASNPKFSKQKEALYNQLKKQTGLAL